MLWLKRFGMFRGVKEYETFLSNCKMSSGRMIDTRIANGCFDKRQHDIIRFCVGDLKLFLLIFFRINSFTSAACKI